MEKELELLEKIQNYCKGHPWCSLCKYRAMGYGCTLGWPGGLELNAIEEGNGNEEGGRKE